MRYGRVIGAVVAGALAQVAWASGPAVWVAGTGGVVRVDAQSGSVLPAPDGVTAAVAMARVGDELLAAEPASADGTTTVVRLALSSWPTPRVGSFVVSGRISAMVGNGLRLVVGLDDGRVVDLDPISGAVLRERQLLGPVHAMLVSDGRVYVSTSVFVFRDAVDDPEFQMAGAAWGIVRSLGWFGGELLMGSDQTPFGGPTTLIRFDISNNAYYLTVPLEEASVSLVVAGGGLLSLDGGGVLRRIDVETGATTGVVARVSPTLGATTAIVAELAIACPADLNGDGVLSPADFTQMLGLYRTGDLKADMNRDLTLSPQDFSAMLSFYRGGCGQTR